MTKQIFELRYLLVTIGIVGSILVLPGLPLGSPLTPAFATAPTITFFSPPVSPPGGLVTITGSGFTGATSVTFGGASATFNVATDSSITAQVPTSGITPGTVSVSVTTSGGTTSASFTIPAPPPAGAPGAPQNPTAIPQSATSVKLTWQDPVSQGAGFSTSGYVIDYGDPTSGNPFTTITGQSSGTIISGLTSGKPYLFKISATNSAGKGPSAPVPFFLSSNFNPNLNFIPPPDISSNSAVTNAMLAKGAPAGFTLPSAELLSQGNFKPFDPSFKDQKLVFTSPMDKGTDVSTLISSYSVQQYSKPSSWTSGSGQVWTVPPAIIPVTGGIGSNAVFSMDSIVPNAPFFLPVTGASSLTNGGNLGGVKLNLAGSDSNVKVNTQFLNTPPTGVSAISNAQMYITLGFKDANSINFGDKNTFQASPEISFTMGAISGSTSPDSPTNTQNAGITCPHLQLGLISGGIADTTGVTVTRDTSGDTSTACGYKATVPHFSSDAVTSIADPITVPEFPVPYSLAILFVIIGGVYLAIRQKILIGPRVTNH